MSTPRYRIDRYDQNPLVEGCIVEVKSLDYVPWNPASKRNPMLTLLIVASGHLLDCRFNEVALTRVE